MSPQDDLVALVKQLQGRLEKLEDEVSHLRKENKQLRVENKQLRAENKQLRAENKQLRAENKQLRVRVNKLENKLRLYDGPNSPSSGIPVYLKPNSPQDDDNDDTKSSGVSDTSATTSPKKRGRDKGHEGVVTVRPPDRQENLKVDKCQNCDTSLLDEAQTKIYGFRKLNLKILTEIVEYMAHKATCPNCGQVSETGPENRETIFGPSALALIGSLWYDCRVPLNRISQFISEITEDNYAETAIINGINAISSKLEPIADQYKQEIFKNLQVQICRYR